MHRLLTIAFALGVAAGCSGTTAEPVASLATTESFAGEWRSVTPSMEFARLSLQAGSSERDALATRLTFSGVAWDGRAQVDGDSLVASLAIAGAASSSGLLVGRLHEGDTLRTEMRAAGGLPLELTFVRDH